MPLNFVVGGAHIEGANSYASVERYRELLAGQGEDDVDLDTLDETIIQRHLINATRFLDQLRWHGKPLNENPSAPLLGLPRRDLRIHGNKFYGEGQIMPEDSVPWVVVDATCYLAEDERITGRALWRSRDQSTLLQSKGSLLGSSKTWANPTAGRSYPMAMALIVGFYDELQSSGIQAVPV